MAATFQPDAEFAIAGKELTSGRVMGGDLSVGDVVNVQGRGKYLVKAMEQFRRRRTHATAGERVALELAKHAAPNDDLRNEMPEIDESDFEVGEVGAHKLKERKFMRPDAALSRRWNLIADSLEQGGAYAGTFHKRIKVPKAKLTEQDLRRLGFQPVTIAIPESGQDQFRSWRHPEKLHHVHSHDEDWVIHEDRHAASTMLAKQEKTVGGKTKAMVAGTPHIVTEGLPGLAAYIGGKLRDARGTAERVGDEMDVALRKRLRRLKDRPSRPLPEIAGFPEAPKPGQPYVVVEDSPLPVIEKGAGLRLRKQGGVPFEERDYSDKAKEIWRALKRDHPDMPVEVKARIALRKSKKNAQSRKSPKHGGPAYKKPITHDYVDGEYIESTAAPRFYKQAAARLRRMTQDQFVRLVREAVGTHDNPAPVVELARRSRS